MVHQIVHCSWSKAKQSLTEVVLIDRSRQFLFPLTNSDTAINTGPEGVELVDCIFPIHG